MTRVLVVEDDASIALALESDLKLEGYEVEVAGDGETAQRLVLASRFNLILLDVTLPGKDGFELCRELRRSGLRIPIILLTARSQEAEKVLGLEIGADDYITKPYSPRELRARIKVALRRTGGETADVCRFGDAEVDFVRCELRCAGQAVDLTPVEFKLLATFVRSPGRVFTRQQLLDLVWGHDVFVSDRVVDNQIMNLRKKIEPESRQPRFLVSVRTVGYRFDG